MDSKKDKVKDKGQAVINYSVTPTSPPEVLKIEEEKLPILTLKERIKKVVEESCSNSKIDDLVVPTEAKAILEKNIFALIQRVLHPEQFCPTCDERLFFNAEDSNYSCPNCGFESQALSNSKTIINSNTTLRPKIPSQVEKAIKQSEEDMKEIPLLRPKTALGDKIRKLVADRDTGNLGGPTKEDDAKVKGQDKNVAKVVNWV